MVIVVNYLTIFSVVQRVYNGRTRPDVEAINKYEYCRDTIEQLFVSPDRPAPTRPRSGSVLNYFHLLLSIVHI